MVCARIDQGIYKIIVEIYPKLICLYIAYRSVGVKDSFVILILRGYLIYRTYEDMEHAMN